MKRIETYSFDEIKKIRDELIASYRRVGISYKTAKKEVDRFLSFRIVVSKSNSQ